METQDYSYKADIVATRKGCVGSSDARMLMQIAAQGSVPKSFYRRASVIKGFEEPDDSLHTQAVEFGNAMEMAIFSLLQAGNGNAKYESNPLWVSERYSRPNVKCIAHPDIVFEDAEHKVINVYEVKTSRHTFAELRKEYNAQLVYQSLVAKEYAEKLGRWKVRMHLVHYNTEGLDLNEYNEFDPERLTVNKVVCHNNSFNLGKAMDILDDFLSRMTQEMTETDIVDAEYLPQDVRKQFDAITAMVREIKERETKIELFKERLYGFLSERGITKVKCSEFSFTVVAPSESVQFDARAFWEKYSEGLTAEEYEKLFDEYKKTIKKKGYVKVSLSNN